jgi:hypothetical protein
VADAVIEANQYLIEIADRLTVTPKVHVIPKRTWDNFFVYTGESLFVLKEIHPYIDELRQKARLVGTVMTTQDDWLESLDRFATPEHKTEILAAHKWLSEQRGEVTKKFAPYLETEL